MTKEQEQAIHDIAQNAREAEKRPYEVIIYKRHGGGHRTVVWATGVREIMKNLKKEYDIGRGDGCTIRQWKEAY